MVQGATYLSDVSQMIDNPVLFFNFFIWDKHNRNMYVTTCIQKKEKKNVIKQNLTEQNIIRELNYGRWPYVYIFKNHTILHSLTALLQLHDHAKSQQFSMSFFFIRVARCPTKQLRVSSYKWILIVLNTKFVLHIDITLELFIAMQYYYPSFLVFDVLFSRHEFFTDVQYGMFFTLIILSCK